MNVLFWGFVVQAYLLQVYKSRHDTLICIVHMHSFHVPTTILNTNNYLKMYPNQTNCVHVTTLKLNTQDWMFSIKKEVKRFLIGLYMHTRSATKTFYFLQYCNLGQFWLISLFHLSIHHLHSLVNDPTYDIPPIKLVECTLIHFLTLCSSYAKKLNTLS